MTKIKICGVTTVEDAINCVELGADAIGLHLADTPRRVSLEQAVKIAEALPPFVSKVGVVTTKDSDILEKLHECRLKAMQLHGEQCEEFSCAMCHYVKDVTARRVKDAASLQVFDRWQSASAYLVDTHVEGLLGGTGKTFDWSLTANVIKRGKPLILAGGLGPDNVAEAVMTVRPFAVDASSRLESEPGKKDYNKVKEFIENVRAADKSS